MSNNPLPLTQVIADIETGKRYPFKIKPEDEDEQSYYPGKRKNSRWLILAYCFMATSPTDRVVHRLRTRLNWETMTAEKITGE